MRGRPRKPHQLRVLEGGRGHSRALTPDLEAPSRPLKAPSGLAKDEALAWREHTARVRELGLESSVDAGAMELLVKGNDTYRTSPEASCLSSEAPDSIHPMLLHAANLWNRWSNLTSRIGGTPLPERPPEEATRAFIGATPASCRRAC